MFPAAQNLPGPHWSDRWPPQHVPASSTAASQHTWKVSLFICLWFACLLFPTLSFFLLTQFDFIVLFWKWCTFNNIHLCLYRQLRRHLSLSMISKLLDGNCTYRPTEKEIQVICLCVSLFPWDCLNDYHNVTVICTSPPACSLLCLALWTEAVPAPYATLHPSPRHAELLQQESERQRKHGHPRPTGEHVIHFLSCFSGIVFSFVRENNLKSTAL